MFPRPDFFAEARLNFAENLLFPENVDIDEHSIAVTTVAEVESHLRTTTWAQLREDVRRCSSALRVAGVKQGDVVAGFVSNHVEALVAMLATAALGGIWTSISPDNGVSAVLDRLVQIEPKALFADNGTIYNGKSWSGIEKTTQVVSALKSLEVVVVIRNISDVETELQGQDWDQARGVRGPLLVVEYEDFLRR